MKQTLLGQAIGRMTKMFLVPIGPLQRFFDSPGVTHIHCLEQAYGVLSQDMIEVVSFFKPYHNSLTKGLYWADQGWKNVYHFYGNPANKGNAVWPGAVAEFQYYFNKALFLMEKDVFKGMFFLGAALHLVQDMCVPHHSVGVIFDGHQEFEKWATLHWSQFPADGSGYYFDFSHPSQFLDYNAKISARYYPQVSLENGCDEASYIEAAQILLPLTIYTTAGFLDFSRSHLKSVTLKYN